MRHLLRCSTRSRHDVELFRRRRHRIARIGQITALIEPVFHPVEYASLESFIDLLLEIRRILFGGLRCGRRSFGEGDPLIIRAEDRCAANALNLERLPAGLIHSQKPYRARLFCSSVSSTPPPSGDSEQFAIRAPARVRRIDRRISYSLWR